MTVDIADGVCMLVVVKFGFNEISNLAWREQ